LQIGKHKTGSLFSTAGASIATECRYQTCSSSSFSEPLSKFDIFTLMPAAARISDGVACSLGVLCGVKVASITADVERLSAADAAARASVCLWRGFLIRRDTRTERSGPERVRRRRPYLSSSNGGLSRYRFASALLPPLVLATTATHRPKPPASTHPPALSLALCVCIVCVCVWVCLCNHCSTFCPPDMLTNVVNQMEIKRAPLKYAI